MTTTAPLLVLLPFLFLPGSGTATAASVSLDDAVSSRTTPAAPVASKELPEDFEPPWCRNWYPDCDGDGFGDMSAPLYTCQNPNLTDDTSSCPYRRNDLDCNDTDSVINPKAAEDIMGSHDGVDNDCDGVVDLDCDGTSATAVPWIWIETPERGVFAPDAPMRVTGVVYPANDRVPLAMVTVGGQDATLTSCSRDGGVWFEATVPLATGVDTIDVRATDEQGRSDRALTSCAHSDVFLPLRDGVPITGSLVTLLNQGTWDILGEYLESLLTAEELQSELLASNPLVSESGSDDCLEEYWITASATGYTHDDVDVSFVVTGGHIATTARLVHPQMWATGTGYYELEWYCGGWDDTVGMTGYMAFSEVVATANAWLSLTSDGQVAVSFTDVYVDARGATVDVDADDWFYDWLIDLFESEMEDELEGFIEDELADYVANDLGPDLAEELNSLDMDYDLDVDGVPYGVTLDYDALDVIDGSVVLGFGMGLSYEPDPSAPVNPGMVTFPAGYTVDVAPTFGLEVGVNFFNAALHALWEGGNLSISSELWSDPAIEGLATPLLPPVIGPSTSDYLLELSLGDVLVGLVISAPEGDPTLIDVALSAKVQLDIDPVLEDGMIGFDLAFAPAEISYDPLGDIPIPAELLEATEGALEALADEILAELEVYLEEMQISYLDLPLDITGLRLETDSGNPAMLSLSGEAVYTGP